MARSSRKSRILWFGDDQSNPLFNHAISGWLIFVAGFGTLLLCTKILKYLLNRKQGALRA